MSREQRSSRSARMLYRPVGLAGSIVGGLVAGQIFKRVWRRASPQGVGDAPGALQSEYGAGQVILVAALQGAVFAAVKAAVDRGGARLFQRWTGEWPGD